MSAVGVAVASVTRTESVNVPPLGVIVGKAAAIGSVMIMNCVVDVLLGGEPDL